MLTIKYGDLLQIGASPYPGYALSVNSLVAKAMAYDANAELFVIAGDDVYPDQTKTAEEIARELSEHFGGTFGVMQPTGDRWGDKQGAYIDRVAGSAWYGREYCRRVNQGNGPLWPQYWHMGVDEEARAVAVKLGVYWERPDLTQLHQHWGRPLPGERIGLSSRMPEFLRKANSKVEWDKYKAIFAARQAAGFPGSKPL
jgi:hypothetical protein